LKINEPARLEFNRGVIRARNAYQARFCATGDGHLRSTHPTLCPPCARRAKEARRARRYRRRKANP